MRKRKLWLVSICLLLCAAFSLPVFAETQPERLFDDAALFSADETERLKERITELQDTIGLDFAIVTTDDAGGLTARAYAGRFYDTHGLGVGTQDSGVLFLIDMDNREAYILTEGYATTLFDGRIEAMLDEVFEYLPDGDYYDAAAAFLDSAEAYALQGALSEGTTPEWYDPVTDTMVAHRSYETGEILVAVFVPLAAAGILFGAVCLLYSRTSKTVAYPFRQQSQLQLTRSEDVFINRIVTTRRIETSSSHGGSHGGSSGRSGGSRGGGGRKF